jgi:hypothetical protein
MGRKVKGTRSKTQVKTFNCGSCGSPVNITILGHTLNVVCKSCHAIIDAKDPNFQVLQKITKQKKYVPYIPLNSRGKLKGILWECTGFMVKSDSGYYWREYLLYNPYHGYRWLVEVDGHWVLYKKIYRAVDETALSGVKYKGKRFKMFNNGTATVRYVEGEFYWRIKLGDKATVMDYIAPPEGLSVEVTENETNWSLGYSIEGSTIKKAFKIKNEPPMDTGVGMIEPSPVKKKLQAAMKPLLYSLGAIFAIFVLRGITASNEVVFSKAYQLNEFSNAQTVVKTESFELRGGTTNVELKGMAKVYNSWVYLDGLLVDADSQKGIPLPLEISYYRGSDWSEGSQNNSRVINNVPSGYYYLNLKLQKGPRPPSGPIELILKRDVPINSNFLFAAILILIGPFITAMRSRNFEVQRWSNSSFSPYSE